MRHILALCAVYLAFAMPVAMLGVAWPEIRELLARSEGEPTSSRRDLDDVGSL